MTEKLKVIASAAVTWLIAASVVVSAAAPQIAELFPANAEAITEWAARVVAWLGAAVLIVRRVTPVPPSERGI